MKTFHIEEFKDLSSRTADPVVSIYVPTRKQSTDSYHLDKVHFKNEVKAVGNALEKQLNLGTEEVEKLLQPAQDLLDRFDFWKYNEQTLAYFLIGGEERIYRLPTAVGQPLHFVGRRPYILPLIPELNHDGHFYLLYLDLNRIRLYEGSRNNFEEIELDPEEIAVSFIEEEKRDENQEYLQGQGGVGQAGVMYHGQGEGSGEDKKVTIQNYFHRMAEMLEPKLNEKPLPLYLAGVEYLIPLYREASHYTHLQKGFVKGGFQETEKKGLHAKAWALAEDNFKQEKKRRKEDYGFKASRNLALSDDKKRLIKAAITGGVDTLWVNNNHRQHLYGEYNEDDFSLKFDEGPNGKNHCLIDIAAVKVLDNGGKVYLVPPEEMPTEALIAGTLRYEVNAVE